MRELREVRNCYFKDFGDGQTFISGLPIPVEPDGVCRGIRFINCDFHAGCDVPYSVRETEFVNCHGRPCFSEVDQEREHYQCAGLERTEDDKG